MRPLEKTRYFSPLRNVGTERAFSAKIRSWKETKGGRTREAETVINIWSFGI